MRILIALVASGLLMSGAQAALDKMALENAMDNPARPAADKERDPMRKAPEVLDFLGLEPGMTAVDLIAIGGWYTEVLSYAVGDSGKVYMHNNASPFVDRNMEIINDRLARLDNVEHKLDGFASIPAGSVDFVLTALNFHDVYNPDPAAAQGFLSAIANVMKPGAILGVIDHEGSPGADNPTLHRIAFDDAVNALLASGQFALVASSDLLHNPNDDHTLGPFDPSLGRDTDRFVLKLVKR